MMPFRSLLRKQTIVTAIVPPHTMATDGTSMNRLSGEPPMLMDHSSSTVAATRPTTVAAVIPFFGLLAAFLYRGPGGFYATPQSLSLQWLMRQMQGRSDNEAVFYRFIPDFDGATQADVEAFASAYLAAAQESSGGYF